MFVLALGLSGCSQGTVSDSENNMADDETHSQETEKESVENNVEQFTGSLKELVKRDKALHCTYEGTMNGDTTKQDIYLAGDTYRIDVVTTLNGEEMRSHMINDGEWIYSWNSITEQGMKMSHDFIEEQGGSEDISVDMEDVSTYSCKSWSKDSSLFSVPSDIPFMNFDELMQGMSDTMGDIPTE